MADTVLYGLEASHRVSPRPSPILFVSDKILGHTVQNLTLSELGTMLCGKTKQSSPFAYTFLGEYAGRFLHHVIM